MRLILLTLLLCLNSSAFGQMDTLQVRFLYGSKPRPEHKKEQKIWFGGMLGGHVGIRYNDTSYLSFFYEGRVHIFQHKNSKNGKYDFQSVDEFNHIMDEDVDSVKTLVIYIPISHDKRLKFDSICASYIKQTPYDYAFFGYRCGSSTYDILAQLGIVKEYSFFKTWAKIFYPKIVRRKLMHQAREHQWRYEKHKGTHKRRWENE